MTIEELTPAQYMTVLALDSVGDWASSSEVKRLGGFPQSLHVLVRFGQAEEREQYRDSDLSATQWRLLQFDQMH